VHGVADYARDVVAPCGEEGGHFKTHFAVAAEEEDFYHCCCAYEVE